MLESVEGFFLQTLLSSNSRHSRQSTGTVAHLVIASPTRSDCGMLRELGFSCSSR